MLRRFISRQIGLPRHSTLHAFIGQEKFRHASHQHSLSIELSRARGRCNQPYFNEQQATIQPMISAGARKSGARESRPASAAQHKSSSLPRASFCGLHLASASAFSQILIRHAFPASWPLFLAHIGTRPRRHATLAYVATPSSAAQAEPFHD